MLQVKGYSISRLDEDVATQLEPSLRLLYERVWDEADYVVPPAENGAFFVTTNVVITPNQTRGLCPEVNISVVIIIGSSSEQWNTVAMKLTPHIFNQGINFLNATSYRNLHGSNISFISIVKYQICGRIFNFHF